MKEKIKSEIMHILQKNDKCLVPELMLYINNNDLNASGDIALFVGYNCMLWNEMSQDFSDALLGLIKEKTVFMLSIDEQSAQLSHMIYGRCPDLPYTCDLIPKDTKHWFPALICRYQL